MEEKMPERTITEILAALEKAVAVVGQKKKAFDDATSILNAADAAYRSALQEARDLHDELNTRLGKDLFETSSRVR